MRFDPERAILAGLGIRLSRLQPLVNGEAAAKRSPTVVATSAGWRLLWGLDSFPGASFVLEVETIEPIDLAGLLSLRYRLTDIPEATAIDSFGIRLGAIENVRAFLRTGYHSWDGSFYVAPDTIRDTSADPKLRQGSAMTQFLPREGEGSEGEGSIVAGILRHDRFQHRFRFDTGDTGLALDIETLWDRIPHGGSLESEPMVLLDHPQVEGALRAWAELVASAAPMAPRLICERITGWCSWYNLYASITEENILDHLAGARAAKESGLPLKVFQIDDGFTPEMGDWLDVKPQFQRGMKGLLADIEAAGFIPGLWIAPFLVGNRSRLFQAHPDWVVRERETGAPLAHMTFYGEFRWHKRSEEYYVLDVTHPDAETYIRRVFRVWRRDWGCCYFKTDFMNAGSDYGPDRAHWHQRGLTRIEIWMRMARLIREEIGADALWLGCGCPLYPAVGLLDAVRIGRDVGVQWAGDQSAKSLLRDQTTRNFANGVLWQADPDCILLRERFHNLSDAEMEALALFAGLAGGLLMTSDHLGELSDRRRELFAFLLDVPPARCEFPLLGCMDAGAPEAFDPLILQVVKGSDAELSGAIVHALNGGDHNLERTVAWSSLGLAPPRAMRDWRGEPVEVAADGLRLRLGAHQSACFVLPGGSALLSILG
jgi:hypothetical protein